MKLKEHYNSLYQSALKKITYDNYILDPLLDSTNDNRFGITLLIRPPDEVKNAIQKFLNELKTIDANQYYYADTDIHVTILSIISCYNGFKLEDINISEYNTLIKQSLLDTKNIEIEFKGITASPSCLLIQGFMINKSLNNLRNTLRKKFKNSTLQQSIDKRYAIQTAHSTVVRFKEKLINKFEFLNIMEEYRNHDFGTFKVNKIELVYNDWYQRAKFVEKLSEFDIKH